MTKSQGNRHRQPRHGRRSRFRGRVSKYLRFSGCRIALIQLGRNIPRSDSQSPPTESAPGVGRAPRNTVVLWTRVYSWDRSLELRRRPVGGISCRERTRSGSPGGRSRPRSARRSRRTVPCLFRFRHRSKPLIELAAAMLACPTTPHELAKIPGHSGLRKYTTTIRTLQVGGRIDSHPSPFAQTQVPPLRPDENHHDRDNTCNPASNAGLKGKRIHFTDLLILPEFIFPGPAKAGLPRCH